MAQARQLATFPISVPAASSLPKSLTFEGINASAKPPGTWGSPIAAGWGPVHEFDFFYTAADGSRSYGAQIQEVGHGFQVSSGPDATPTTLAVAGHQVQKQFRPGNDSDVLTVSFYQWNNGKTFFSAEVTYSKQFTEQDFEAIIASTLSQ